MCGIFGVWRYDGAPIDPDDVVRCRDLLRARGPDDAGLHVEAGVALAHRRLSILDLSPAGRMPMSNETGDVWAVFNGEIYNFVELRRELEGRGHTFRSRTDSEVVIHAWEQWGDDCFARLDGMFAIAVWDRRDRRLVLARDAAGEKPLFYARDGQRVVFASTLAPILAWPDGPREIDRGSVHEYGGFGFVPAPRSLVRGVTKVRPGTYVVIEADGRARSGAHFDLEALARAPRPARTLRQSVDLAERVLRDAVRSSLVSDVPLGAFLSGGVDSSLVVALMSEVDRDAVRTFTIGFREPEYDESPYARAIAEHLGVQNTVLVLSSSDVLAEASAVSEAFDEPMADYSALPTLAVSRLARRHVTVALTGDGGDEAFAGYRYYAALRVFERAHHAVPSPVRALLPHVARGVPWPRARRALARAATPDAATFFGRSGFYRGATLERGLAMVLPDVMPRPDEIVASCVRDASTRGVGSVTEAALLWDATHTLPDAWLCKVDRASMAVSLETRAPLLRRAVLELAFSLPVSHRVLGIRGKRVLRALLRRYVPSRLVDRPKQGFAPPMARWLRQELREPVADLLSRSRIARRGFFDPGGVERVVEQHLRREADHAQLIWALYQFERWCERHLDGPLESRNSR